MRYSIKQVIRRFQSNKKIYLKMIFQFIIGFFMLNIFLTAWFQIRTDTREIYSEGLINRFTITAKLKDSVIKPENQSSEKLYNDTLKNSPFKLEDIKHLQEKYNIESKIFTRRNIVNFSVENTYDYICFFETGIKKASMSESFANLVDNWNSYLDDTVNPEELNIENISKDNRKILNTTEAVAYLPYEYLNEYKVRDLINTEFIVDTSDLGVEKMAIFIGEIKEYFSQNNSEYKYEVNGNLFSFLRKTEAAKQVAILFQTLGFIVICINTISMTGIISLIIKKREKEMAIFISLGQAKKNIILELIMELMIIFISSSLIGGIIAQVILFNGLEIATVNIFSNQQILFCLVLESIALTLFALVPSIVSIHQIEPMELIRGSE